MVNGVSLCLFAGVHSFATTAFSLLFLWINMKYLFCVILFGCHVFPVDKKKNTKSSISLRIYHSNFTFFLFFRICSSHNLDERFFSQSPLVNVLQIRWHPASPKDCNLLVLLSDNTIRWVFKIVFVSLSCHKFIIIKCGLLITLQGLRWFCAEACMAHWSHSMRSSAHRLRPTILE